LLSFSLDALPPTPSSGLPGELQSPGTGPFFGEKTHFAKKRLAENMDLSPLRRDFAVLCAVKRLLFLVGR